VWWYFPDKNERQGHLPIRNVLPPSRIKFIGTLLTFGGSSCEYIFHLESKHLSWTVAKLLHRGESEWYETYER
jgi:hypothetical protein